MAREALKEVCVFVSACNVGVDPKHLANDLSKWFREHGAAEIRPDSGTCEEQAPEEESDETDAEGDDEGTDLDSEPEEAEEPSEAEVHEKQLCEALAAVEMQVALETELAQMLGSGEKPEMPKSAQDELPKSDVENETDEETEPKSPQKKASRAEDQGHIVSLADVLKVAGLQNYHPPKHDTDEKAIARTRACIPGMLSFSVFMQCGQELLSRPTILGRTKARISPFHQAEHALAMARSAHMCDAGLLDRFHISTLGKILNRGFLSL